MLTQIECGPTLGLGVKDLGASLNLMPTLPRTKCVMARKVPGKEMAAETLRLRRWTVATNTAYTASGSVTCAGTVMSGDRQPPLLYFPPPTRVCVVVGGG